MISRLDQYTFTLDIEEVDCTNLLKKVLGKHQLQHQQERIQYELDLDDKIIGNVDP